ncbi:hypothetical protein ESA94_02225 [Lacibacter luteus]|uniref:HEAT repeat domain-containing protein n=1 Tax=Lacibacter luteus TaxID=2508719 RepID=A0A4Q1CM53_9BACT|nr:hypothetical protein [Lacibacter luteus]RXK61854.1 hypothetical protein ESA94_02225 [Lacibacter luteus]
MHLNLREEILAEHSKAQAAKIVQWIGTSQKRMDELVHLFTTDEYRVVQRAAWPIGIIGQSQPQLLKKHLPVFVSLLRKPGVHNAVRRNITRALQHISIPEELKGDVMDCCFEFISNPKEATAVKAFSLTVLQNLSQEFPEILPEIVTIIETRWEHESAAFKSRARKMMKEK